MIAAEQPNIEHEDKENKGIFLIWNEKGNIAAELTYSKAGENRIIIDHTIVHEELKGTGIGKKLVEKAIEYARAEKKIITPLCPFANAYMMKQKEKFQDVLD